MTETPGRTSDDEVDDFEDRSLSEATPWESDSGRNASDLDAATSVGDESAPKDTDEVPNV